MTRDTINSTSQGRMQVGAAKAKTCRFLLLELQVPMVVGALVCLSLARLVLPDSGLAAVYHPGTYLFMIGDILYLTVPVVAWMVWRGHGWRCGLKMAGAMLAPVAVVILVGESSVFDYRLWLITGMYPSMVLGMLIYLFYSGDMGRRS